MDYATQEVMSKVGFSVQIAGGDYYFVSDLATAMSDLVSVDVVTVYFLFDREHRLKDVYVEKWTDGI